MLSDVEWGEFKTVLASQTYLSKASQEKQDRFSSALNICRFRPKIGMSEQMETHANLKNISRSNTALKCEDKNLWARWKSLKRRRVEITS